MAGSSIGTIFRISTWGESHGKALGVVVDGCPAGLDLCEADIQAYLDRRKPGQSALTTQRKEADAVEILSGVFEGKTTGTPISLLVRNTSQISKDYSDIAKVYRPGHADYTFDAKFGLRDYRGGGRSSGRETIGRVAAGAIAAKCLSQLGILVCAYTKSIAEISAEIPADTALLREISLKTASAMPDEAADEKATALLLSAKEALDSVGGVMECQILGVPAGLGDPVFEKLDANLAKAAMSIGAVKAVEIGDGCAVTKRRGSENNDAFSSAGKLTNHAGGILGGISDGDPIIVRAHVKPTPSIYQTQKTINKAGEEVEIAIKGRHDPIIVPRAVVVLEAMCAITILDALLVNMGAKMEGVATFYNR